MNPSRCHLPVFLMMALSCVITGAEADHTTPVSVPDEFGLGERLALIDWLRERRIGVPDNAELPALRRLYLTAVAGAKPTDPEELKRKEESEQLRLQLWRRFSVNTDPAMAVEDLRRQLAELQAQQQGDDERRQKNAQEEPPADQGQTAVRGGDKPPAPSPEQPVATSRVVPAQPLVEVHPLDGLLAEHGKQGSSLQFRDDTLLDGLQYLIEQRRVPVGSLWTPAEAECWSRIAPIVERQISSWENPTGAVMKGRMVSLGGPDPAGEQAVSLRRRLIERAVRSLTEPPPASLPGGVWPHGQRWAAVHGALDLHHAEGAQLQHWLVLQDRQWARALIPELLTALGRDLGVKQTDIDVDVLVAIAAWCAASAPPGLSSQALALADKIAYPLARLRFLAACSGAGASALRVKAFAALDDQSLEQLRWLPRLVRDPQVAEALVQRLMAKPAVIMEWGERVASAPLTPATCVRMIDLGLQSAPSLNTESPDPRALWLPTAARNAAVRGCLSPTQRVALQTAQNGATGRLEMMLNTLALHEEPDQRRRADLMGRWMQSVIANPAAGPWQGPLRSTLVRGLWIEQVSPPEATLQTLKDLRRYHDCRQFAERILARYANEPDTQPSTPPASLHAKLSASFDADQDPQQIDAWLSAGTKATGYDVMGVAQILPAGAGAPWVATVMGAFDRWWSAPTPDGQPHRATTALSIGVWAAASGSIEWSLIWAQRADKAALLTGERHLDGSVIYALAKPDHPRTRIWLEEHERLSTSHVPLIRWLVKDRTRPLPAELDELPDVWPQILGQLIVKGRAGRDIIAPLLDARLAFKRSSGEGAAMWQFLLSRLDP